MRCAEVWEALAGIHAGNAMKLPSPSVEALKGLGLISFHGVEADGGAAATGNLDRIRERIAEIGRTKLEIDQYMERTTYQNPGFSPSALMRKYPEYKARAKRREALEAEERTLRTKFINALQSSLEKSPRASLNHVPVLLTYRGREVLTILGQRMQRVADMDIQAFLNELGGISYHFDARAKKAFQLLKILSPAYQMVDEVHVRMVSIGLAAREASAQDTATLFKTAIKGLTQTLMIDTLSAFMLAEVIALRSRGVDDVNAYVYSASSLLKARTSDSGGNQDQQRAVAIILASGGPVNDLYQRTENLAVNMCYGSYSAAAVLACSEYGSRDPGVVERYSSIYGKMHYDYYDPASDTMAAALMASSGLPENEVLERYNVAYEHLERFNGGSMRVPAAMIAILPTGVNEAMDNVRLASAAIMKHKMSLGGAENLSLGIKTLVHSSAIAVITPGTVDTEGVPEVPFIPTMGAPTVLALTGISVASAFALGATMIVFHEASLHQIALQDFTFHPVHSHYVYGHGRWYG